MSDFKSRLKELRKEYNLTAKQFGAKIGVSDATIVRWENGQMSPKAEYIVLICRFFNISADYLLGLVD